MTTLEECFTDGMSIVGAAKRAGVSRSTAERHAAKLNYRGHSPDGFTTTELRNIRVMRQQGLTYNQIAATTNGRRNAEALRNAVWRHARSGLIDGAAYRKNWVRGKVCLPWTESEKKSLIRLWTEGHGYRGIAAALGRSHYSVRGQLDLMKKHGLLESRDEVLVRQRRQDAQWAYLDRLYASRRARLVHGPEDSVRAG